MFVGLFVRLSVFLHDISKTDAVRLTKLDKEMFHHEFWKPIYLEVKRSKAKVTRHKNIAGMDHDVLISASYF